MHLSVCVCICVSVSVCVCVCERGIDTCIAVFCHLVQSTGMYGSFTFNSASIGLSDVEMLVTLGRYSKWDVSLGVALWVLD